MVEGFGLYPYARVDRGLIDVDLLENAHLPVDAVHLRGFLPRLHFIQSLEQLALSVEGVAAEFVAIYEVHGLAIQYGCLSYEVEHPKGDLVDLHRVCDVVIHHHELVDEVELSHLKLSLMLPNVLNQGIPIENQPQALYDSIDLLVLIDVVGYGLLQPDAHALEVLLRDVVHDGFLL